jgi:hypothetical protein
MNTFPTANDGLPRMLAELTGAHRRVYEAVRDWAPRPDEPASPSVLHLHHRLHCELNAAQLLDLVGSLVERHLLMPGEAWCTPSHRYATFVAKVYDAAADDAAVLRAPVPAAREQEELFPRAFRA